VSSLEVATWNAEWKGSRSREFAWAQERISELAADILVLTEVTTDLLPGEGSHALGGTDWGYRTRGNRRKVALWSKWPIEAPANDLLDPPGRHLAATVKTPLGPVRLHAICVPWRDAHVRDGRADSGAWQEHLKFLQALSVLLASERDDPAIGQLPRIVLGDVNQRGGRHSYRSEETREAWDDLLEREDLTICTPDEIVDKIALGPELVPEATRALPPDGISDHHAVAATVRMA
jgi:endonuclease/exonuclease/phosphatase family metal-dependent hydrolase